MTRSARQAEPIVRITLTLPEAAEAAGCSERHIRRAIAARELPVCRLGARHCTRVRVCDLQRWVDRHTSRLSRSARDAE